MAAVQVLTSWYSDTEYTCTRAIYLLPLVTSMQLSPQRRDDRAGSDWQCGPDRHHPAGALEAARHHSRQAGVRPIPE